jgi:alkaline phosphatase D
MLGGVLFAAFIVTVPGFQPDARDPVHKIAFGSCNKQYSPQPLWDAIAARNPSLWVWLGDMIYADHPIALTLSEFAEEESSYRAARPL